MVRDYYGVLGIGVAATPAQIRRAFQRLARRYSPDVNLWDHEASGLFEEISQAYRVLSDPTARRLYDRQGTPGPRPEAAGRSSRRASGRRGDDLHLPVDLTFAQAVSGASLEVTVERLSPCDACDSTGARPGAHAVTCGHCAGTGLVWMSRDGRPAAEQCPACEGAGERITEPCPACRGRGVTPARADVLVTVPPGMETGGQLRIAGEGHAGPFGGPRGDLLVITRVQDDSVFTRKGHNLYCELPLTIVEAVLGAQVPLQTVQGPVDLQVPAGTQSGQVFRLRGRGMPRLAGSGRGDLYVTARVEIPSGLDARSRELFGELARLLPAPPRRTPRTMKQAST
jgi:molecular chaperone DnaJ